ncbi:hypothetical protein AB9K32_07790 [Allomuricauda sp. XS_ASV26]|uniref:hypothetical protein n=1 Tax=Allomuricauda sp. XS_ASV26 TaxID=3241292 RepID=UPI0035142F15
MYNSLNIYIERGEFTFNVSDNLNNQCNAPKHSSGVYLIYKEKVSESNLVYIGISGREGTNGEIIHRKDGIKGRLVSGKQFGEPRRRSWPKKMIESDIELIIIKWYVTFGRYNQDFPRPIENGLLSNYLNIHGKLPEWNNEI